MPDFTESELIDIEKTAYTLTIMQRDGTVLTPDQEDWLQFANTVIESVSNG